MITCSKCKQESLESQWNEKTEEALQVPNGELISISSGAMNCMYVCPKCDTMTDSYMGILYGIDDVFDDIVSDDDSDNLITIKEARKRREKNDS